VFIQVGPAVITTPSNQAALSTNFQALTKACGIECVSLDGIVQQFGIHDAALLKIDCEGFEYDSLYDSDLFRLNRVRGVLSEFHAL